MVDLLRVDLMFSSANELHACKQNKKSLVIQNAIKNQTNYQLVYVRIIRFYR